MAESKGSPFTPYVTTLNEDDPMVRKVPCDHMPIAANPPSMPDGKGEGPGNIQHVGGGKK
jgi:hypothetical protein